jgi:hypothetical protein
MRMHMHLVTPSIRCQTIIYKILHRKPEGEGELRCSYAESNRSDQFQNDNNSKFIAEMTMNNNRSQNKVTSVI